MQKNVGGTDKAVRIVAGVGIIAAGVYFQSGWGAIGVVPLLTAAMGWCPPYALLGIDTCKAATGDQQPRT